jgi:hypothetical protein
MEGNPSQVEGNPKPDGRISKPDGRISKPGGRKSKPHFVPQPSVFNGLAPNPAGGNRRLWEARWIERLKRAELVPQRGFPRKKSGSPDP